MAWEKEEDGQGRQAGRQANRQTGSQAGRQAPNYRSQSGQKKTYSCRLWRDKFVLLHNEVLEYRDCSFHVSFRAM
jgi:hypothetical protein